jgi:hypothetical protein
VVHIALGVAIIVLAVGSIVWFRILEHEIRGGDDD